MHLRILNWNIAIVAVLTDFTNMAVMLSDLLRNLTFNRSAHCTQVSDQCPLGLLFLALLLLAPHVFQATLVYFSSETTERNLRQLTGFPQSLKSPWILGFPWKRICPWKVLEFRGPSLKFQLVVLDFLFCVFWTERLKGYSKLRGTRANFPPKISARFARSSLQVKYFPVP